MRLLSRRSVLFIPCLALAAATVFAQAPGVLGYWREPGGSVIRIIPCGQKVCVEIAGLPPGKHRATDGRNPDPKLRSRLLCGLRIGEGFVEVDPQTARGGRLYDPRNGRTYSGQMAVDGVLLRLRGYVGLPMFGRTQTWTRASRPPPC